MHMRNKIKTNRDTLFQSGRTDTKSVFLTTLHIHTKPE